MNIDAMVFASLAGDCLALGAHWIYDQEKIEEQFGTIRSYQSPLPGSYHSSKTEGDFTHYGDQTLLLLKSLWQNRGFTQEQFGRDWQSYMLDYSGYVDKASSQTLSALQAGGYGDCGSNSTELGGAARIAPLIYLYHQDEHRLMQAVREQTAMTHDSHAVLEGAALLAKITIAILQGASLEESVENTIGDGIDDLALERKLKVALDSAGRNSRDTIKELGLGCGISAALPGVIHLALTYPDDLAGALIENVMAGGDSAARGLALGMLLGAANGLAAVPPDWIRSMRAYNEVVELLVRLDELSIR